MLRWCLRQKLLLLYRRKEQEKVPEGMFPLPFCIPFCAAFPIPNPLPTDPPLSLPVTLLFAFTVFRRSLHSTQSCKKHLVFFQQWWVYMRPIFFGQSISQGSVFSNYSYYEHFFSFCCTISFENSFSSSPVILNSRPLRRQANKKKFIETKQCGWGSRFFFVSRFYSNARSKMNVSVRIDNNLHNENSTRKYPHNYVHISWAQQFLIYRCG